MRSAEVVNKYFRLLPRELDDLSPLISSGISALVSGFYIYLLTCRRYLWYLLPLFSLILWGSPKFLEGLLVSLCQLVSRSFVGNAPLLQDMYWEVFSLPSFFVFHLIILSLGIYPLLSYWLTLESALPLHYV